MRALLILTIVVLGGAASGFTGCDPTEAAFGVTLLNDTHSTLVVDQCGYGCGSRPTETHKLTPGASVGVNTSSGHVDNWWRITTSSGHAMGCLNLLYDHKEPDAVVPLSGFTACPAS